MPSGGGERASCFAPLPAENPGHRSRHLRVKSFVSVTIQADLSHVRRTELYSRCLSRQPDSSPPSRRSLNPHDDPATRPFPEFPTRRGTLPAAALSHTAPAALPNLPPPARSAPPIDAAGSVRGNGQKFCRAHTAAPDRLETWPIKPTPNNFRESTRRDQVTPSEGNP